MNKREIETNLNDEIIAEPDYKFGYVAAIDILGFADLSAEEANYLKIRDLMNLISDVKTTMSLNLERIKFNICSDTVFITYEIRGAEDFDEDRFKSILNEVCLAHHFIASRVGHLSRAGITLGKYVRAEGRSNILFGPAVTKAALLAEKMDKICPNHELFLTRPAAIVVDKMFFDYPDSRIKEEIRDSCLKSFLEDNCEFVRIDSGYYLVNPYFAGFNHFQMGSWLCNEKKSSNQSLQLYIAHCREVINRAAATHPGKISIEAQMLNEFEKYVKVCDFPDELL